MPSNLLVSEADFSDWLQHPVTLLLRAHLTAKREELKDRWAGGDFTNQEHFGTAMKNAEAIGACVVYANLLALEYEDLAGE